MDFLFLETNFEEIHPTLRIIIKLPEPKILSSADDNENDNVVFCGF